MDRRSFLSSIIASGALYAGAGLPGFSARAAGSEFAMTGNRHLVSIFLEGGPDFRHLFPPAFSDDTTSFGHAYWHATAASHAAENNNSSLNQRWQQDYFHLEHDGQQFGMLNSCGWLKSMWDQGNVAIVNNVLTTSSRNHPLGILVAEQGDRSITPNDFRNPGWGGRLADASQKNVLSLTKIPRDFCFGADQNNPNNRSDQRLVSASNTRSITLYSGDPEDWQFSQRSSITRSLNSYYRARRSAFSNIEAAARFAEHERKLRVFGEPIDQRLQNVPLPASIERLFDREGLPLFDFDFGQQIRNLYDSLACTDILNMGMAALRYKGWDTHRDQKTEMEPRLIDLFGPQQALDTLFTELPTAVSDDLVIVLQGEFGRQIRANGDGGTDHGEGNSMIVIGKSVAGGIYGEMFPRSELATLDQPSPQIEGKTAVERVYSELCDWLSPGTSSTVFPQASSSPIENQLQLGGLLT